MKMRYAYAFALLSLLLAAFVNASAQDSKAPATSSKTTTTTPPASTATAAASTAPAGAAVTITPTTAPVDLARAAITAMGGDKYRNMKSLTLLGSAELFSPNSQQALPAKFAIVTAGDRYRLEIQSPLFSLRNIYDGQQSYNSMPNFNLPPPSKFGVGLLNKFDQSGYVVSALPDRKKQRAFRITDPEGNATDFYVDATSGRLMGYSFPYMGNTVGMENKSFKEVDGVMVPFAFTQKFETPQGAFYAEFKVKEAKVNQALSEDVFTIPAQ